MFEVWKIEECMMLIYLIVGAIIDIAKRKISVWYLMVGGGIALWYLIRVRKETGIMVALGIVLGVLFLCLSKITNQGIGYGDSWMILILGAYLGFWKLLVVLAIAFLSVSIIAGIGFANHMVQRKTRIPFLPFLLIGYLGVYGW